MKLSNTKHLLFALILTSVITAPAMANIARSNEAVVILGLQSSKAVLAGNYEMAIKLASSKKRIDNTPLNRAAENISLCVAQLKSGNLDSAQSACETAKQIATSAKNFTSTGIGYYTKPKQFQKTLIKASEQNLALIAKFK